jgi:hypothetical protein
MKKIMIGKGEAGTALYQDTGKSIEIGEVAYTIKREDAFSGETETLYFKEQISAEMYKDGNGITQLLS